MEIHKREWILFGAGDEGKKLVNLLKNTDINIYAYADNDIEKVGTVIDGIKVISFAEMKELYDKYDIVVSVSPKYEDILIKQLKSEGVKRYYKLEEAYDAVRYKSIPELKKYKNKYKGRRCFIIGTGPSLTVKDLEILQSNREISIASNKIFKIFDKTTWRPDIYCTIDNLVLKEYGQDIVQLPIETILLANNCINKLKENIDYFRLIYKPYDNDTYPEFSSEPDKYVIEGFSVTYAIMQWASYMGFTEMYLLGIDFDYGNKETGYKHFINNYDKKDEKVNPPRLDKCLKAYEMAEMYSRKNGFRIYKATRGGKLEVFERVDFDSLFRN